MSDTTPTGASQSEPSDLASTLRAERDAARAEATRLRDFVDAAKNILQSVEKASPVEIRAWLAALEKTR